MSPVGTTLASKYASSHVLRIARECIQLQYQHTEDTFQKLTEKSMQMIANMQYADVGRLHHLNRYRDVIPFEHSRVVLREPIQYVRHGVSSNYVNASWIKLPSREPLYDKDNREYIATQGPLLESAESFWRMVLEQQVRKIIMLTPLVERGRVKCDKYFPEQKDEVLQFGDIHLTVAEMLNREGMVERKIQVRQEKHGDVVAGVEVQHYQVTDWPDHGVPRSPELVFSILDVIESASPTMGLETPIVVHCSAGIGRSGVVIALDVIYRRLKALGAYPETPTSAIQSLVRLDHIVLGMRNQRISMVQNAQQYRFCCQSLLELVDEALLCTPAQRV